MMNKSNAASNEREIDAGEIQEFQFAISNKQEIEEDYETSGDGLLYILQKGNF